MDHYAGPVTHNQLILLGLCNSEVSFLIALGFSYEDILEGVVEQLTHS